MDKFKLRFIPLGGIVGVTKNMYLYELYRNDTIENIIIVDCGIGFPKEHELGVDYVIPDVSYLDGKTHLISAVLLTHGHEDHISALKHVYERLGRPPVYGSRLTSYLIEEKFKEVGLNLSVKKIEYRKDYEFGSIKARFIHSTHSIPDSTHILIKTPVGNFYHGADFKLDLTPPFSPPADFYEMTKAGEDGVLCLLSDCLGAEKEGLTLSESIVGKTFEDEMRTTRGKFIMTTFSSNISRIRQCTDAAVKFNRKICFLGRSMHKNALLAKSIGLLKINQNFFIEDRDLKKYKSDKVCIIAAGSQGQYGSALSRIASGENKYVTIVAGDKVFFSSDPIPGQEDDVYDLIERLYKFGAKVIYSDIAEGLHASGHGNQEDLKFLMRFVKPKFLIPIGGTIRHQRQYLEIAKAVGFKDNQVQLLDNGQTVFFEKDKLTAGATIDTANIYVDAYGVGDVGNIILRDREVLSKEGVIVAVIAFDKNFNLVRPPELLARGFLLEDQMTDIFNLVKARINKFAETNRVNVIGDGKFRNDLIKILETEFLQKTGKRPLVIVDLINI